MAGTNSPPRPAPPGLGDLLNLFGSNNPLTALTRSIEQFRSGVTGFIEVVQTFRQTLETLNGIAQRVNRMLDDFEGPMRAIMPQVTRSAEQAARMFAILSEPVERVAPGIAQLAELLDTPAVTELPRRLTEAMDVVNALPNALGPIGQMAEMAGGFFGGSRGFGLTGGGARPRTPASGRPVTPFTPFGTPAPAAVNPATPARGTAPKKAAAKKATSHSTTRTARSAQAAFERSAAKKAPAKRAPTKKATAKRAPSKKAAAKKAPAKRSGASR